MGKPKGGVGDQVSRRANGWIIETIMLCLAAATASTASTIEQSSDIRFENLCLITLFFLCIFILHM